MDAAGGVAHKGIVDLRTLAAVGAIINPSTYAHFARVRGCAMGA